MTRKKFINVEEYGKHWAFKVRDSKQFKEFRIPAWAKKVSNSISKNSYVIMGKTKNNEWKVQSIKIERKGKSRKTAEGLALKILEKIGK